MVKKSQIQEIKAQKKKKQKLSIFHEERKRNKGKENSSWKRRVPKYRYHKNNNRIKTNLTHKR